MTATDPWERLVDVLVRSEHSKADEQGTFRSVTKPIGSPRSRSRNDRSNWVTHATKGTTVPERKDKRSSSGQRSVDAELPSDQNEQVALGARLREAREYIGLLQEDVASALEIPRTSVHALEAGKRKVTGLELRRLARLYRRPVGWLLGEEDVELKDAEPLFRAAAALSDEDREQVLRFAEFLAAAGNANKDAVRDAARDRGGLPAGVTSDECDAWWLRQIGLHLTGRGGVVLPKTHQAALDKLRGDDA